MQGTVLEETEAFILRQREQLIQQRQELLNEQEALQQRLEQVDEMLRKFDIFAGKAPAPRQSARGRRASGARRGSKREELLRVIREGNGLSRGEILQIMGLKGDKSGEMSVSNGLTALTKSNQVIRLDGKYTVSSG